MSTPLALPLTDEKLSLFEKRNPWPVGLWHGNPSKQPKNYGVGAKSLEGKFSLIDVYARISCWSVPLQRKCEFIVPVTKKHPLFRCHFAPIWPGRQTFDIWVRLHTPVKLYPDPLRFAGVNRGKAIHYAATSAFSMSSLRRLCSKPTAQYKLYNKSYDPVDLLEKLHLRRKLRPA